MSQSRYLELMGIEQYRLRSKPTQEFDNVVADVGVGADVERVRDESLSRVDRLEKSKVSLPDDALLKLPAEEQPLASQYHPCPLCLNSLHHLVVSESETARWYWLVEGDVQPLLDDIITASKTQRRDGEKRLACGDRAETCKDMVTARMGANDVLLIVGVSTAKLLLQRAAPFDFESSLGQQAEKLWQVDGNTTVVLPSIEAMKFERLNKKQAWLNLQQVM